MKTLFLMTIFSGLILVTASIPAQEKNKTNEIPVKGTWNFNPKKIWEITKAGNDTFGRPGEPRVGNDGILFLHDFAKKLSYIFDENGKLIKTFADETSDKPQISMYLNCFTVDDKVIIGAMDQLHFYKNDGSFIKSVPNNIFERFPLTFIDENKFYLGPGALAGLPQGKGRVVLLDATDNTETTYSDIILTESEKKSPPGMLIVGLIPQILMAYDKDNHKVYYAKNNDYRIHITDVSGKTLNTFGRNIPKIYVSIDQKKEHLNSFLNGKIPDDRLTQMVKNMPDSLAYFHSMLFNNGLIYLFSMTGLSTKYHTQEIDIFSKDGAYLYNGIIDFGDYYFLNGGDIQIKNDFIYTMLVNGEGKRVIAKYKIEVPSN